MDLWVTGLGLVCPLGVSAEESWRRLRSGTPPETRTVAGWNVVPAPWSGKGLPPESERSSSMAVAACGEAAYQAGLGSLDPTRVGCSFSSSKGGVGALLRTDLDDRFRLEGYFPHAAGLRVRTSLGLRGPCLSFASACATGSVGLMKAAHWILGGECDAVLAGATESALVPLIVSGFGNMGLLSRRESGPAPFDRHRDGFWMGEAAAVLVLESSQSAMARGAKPLARFTGWKIACDHFSSVDLDPSGVPIRDCAAEALRRAGIGPDEVDYINAHGTGTRLNDRVESKALSALFGSSGPWISSTKSATGHCLGASAAVEAVWCVKVLQKGWAPATRGLKDSDAECPLKHVPQGGVAGAFRNVLSLNYGLGGHLAALVFSKA